MNKPKPAQFMPVFNNNVFGQSLADTENSLRTVVASAAKAGQFGGSVAAKSMKSIKDHPCDKSPAPGCVTP
eukprot:CAMPEP_0174915194 /NCGR_PEP_ID=MMETSP1355-20121228/650_1 /TAXON_ID=464990 /ORGANISM="Hemiselmis tepida, Strain CCMP443" /LENGTH=70 /DNA_ID=CAMNT_0016160043 /DNA_START=232 /DNA_END=444 /DNA_ORIENTATION=-